MLHEQVTREDAGRWRRLVRSAFAPIDIAGLVWFRIALGLLLTWQAWRMVVEGRLAEYYLASGFHFSYFGFGWVRPVAWIEYLPLAIGLAGALLAIGLAYRLAAIVSFVSLAYLFLLDQAQYLNHVYLELLILFLMIFLPAHRALSVDAKLRPCIRSDAVPAWTLWLLRAQLAVVYVYAGIAKINPDWLRGEPLRTWLGERSDFPILGPVLSQEWCVMLFAYGGLLFDLLVPFALLYKKTRGFAVAFSVFFHLMNATLFSIGVFPWFALVATTLFFEPDWPRRARFLLPPLRRPVSHGGPAGGLRPGQKATAWLVATYLAIQVAVPARHLLYPGTVAWTEEGHRFSWRMKLRDKEATIWFVVTAPDRGRSWHEDPRSHLSRRQVRKMSGRPDMILQFAHHLGRLFERQGYGRVEVRADAFCSLNGHPARRLIDPDVDLVQQKRTLWHADWILPPPTRDENRSPRLALHE